MPANQLERPATERERRALDEILAAVPDGLGRWKMACQNAFLMWCALSVLFVLVWSAGAWAWRRLFGADYGLHGESAPAVFGIVLPLLAVYPIVSTIRWASSWKDPSPVLRQDVESGVVLEERHVFVEAKRFQEQEHGGLIYFLLSPDGRTFVHFDLESQELGITNRDPLRSPFTPRTELRLVRGPRSGRMISAIFDGTALDAGPPIELAAPPEEWPESEQYCDIAWSDLETRLGRAVD